MRVLLDESLPRQLAARLLGHEVVTVASQGWSGTRNGELLRLASDHSFSIFITADQGIQFQQNLSGLEIGVVVVKATSNRMEHLLPFVERISQAIETSKAGELVLVA